LEEEARYLGAWIVSLLHLFSPEAVIIGGGVGQAFDLLSPVIADVVRRDAMTPFKDTRILPAGLGDNAGLVGAATLACEGAGGSA
jgi:glucokinase